MTDIYILHENDEWVLPLRQAFSELGIQAKEWFLDEGTVDFNREPPQGVFYNRMSASSHTRGHRFAPELTRMVLTWLQRHDRRVLNNTHALYLELCKLSQYAALNRAGVKTPRTIAAVGRPSLLTAAAAFADAPFILKPNRGGKGVDVQLFQDRQALQRFVDADGYAEPLDGIWLLQQFVRSPQPYITRCEFIGGDFLYAVTVSTAHGFELCPADTCQVGEAHCPTTQAAASQFTITHQFDQHPILGHYRRFLADNGIDVAGIEFVQDGTGEIYTYDVNTNTNYNRRAELDAAVPLTGMGAIARLLRDEAANLSG